MITKIMIPIAAAAGLIFAIVFVIAGTKSAPASQPVAEPPAPPFPAYIAGAGIVEASSENIAVGAPVSGTVTELFVHAGDAVKKGTPLFKIDDRDLSAELINLQAAVSIARAEVAVEQAGVADLENQYDMWNSIKQSDARAVSQQEFDRRKFALGTGNAKLLQAQARAEAAAAGVEAVKTLIDRTTVRAPVDGEVLQVKIRLGEFASAGVLSQPLMLVGDVATLHVRVDVDENDAWRLHANARARAFLRGNSEIATDVKFVRVEPYVLPKRSLTGESTERVDTRVLQVLFSFDRAALPVYVGQQMDVVIEAPPVGGGRAAPPARG